MDGSRWMGLVMCSVLVGCFDDPETVETGADGTTTESTGTTTTTSITSTTSMTSTSEGSDTGTTGNESALHFFDDFERPNGPELGNGWVQKNDAVFRLEGGRLQGTMAAPPGLGETFVYQVSDSHRDIEISVEFVIENADPLNEPMLALRVHEDTLTDLDDFDGYVLVAGGEDPPNGTPTEQSHLCIQRQFGQFGPSGWWCQEMDPEGLVTGFVYRMTFATVGIQPVDLFGLLERRDPEAGDDAWETIAIIMRQDTDDERIGERGAYGISGGVGGRELPFYSYDNFTAELL